MATVSTHRVSHATLITAFENTRKANIVAFILSNELIPLTSIVVAFKNAARRGEFGHRYYYPDFDQVEIIALLRKRNDIPGDVINDVFAEAMLHFCSGVLKALSNDPRLRSELRFAGLAKLADKGCIQALQALVNEKLFSLDEMTKVLVKAASAGHTAIVRLLLDKFNVPATVMREAIIAAARNNHNAVARYLCKYKVWPADVFQEALQATSHKKLSNFLRTFIAPSQTDSTKFDGC
ncbi:unnamed protein product [Phytophthora fragariaefolia]|uniref:Unnamed protein product n=1 Tax=Phytophthora fragariaefolia TaxID=1490495 RepID=A0A9W6XUU9_9STRA|nr:unnamed protein product [Phytophthora fragariaefolia]